MREASGMERHPSVIRHGRCAVHAAAPAIAACDVCGRALCLPCSVRLSADEQDEVIGYVMSSIR